MAQRHRELKLTEPQFRILDDAVRNGKTVVGGRNIEAVTNLRKAGLVTDDWQTEPSAQGGRWSITVKPTDAGKDLIYGH